MNYKDSSHYKFGIVVAKINLFIYICSMILALLMGALDPDRGAGGSLAMCAISGLVLSLLGILNIIFNIVLYNLNDKEIKWDNFPKNFSDYFYLYFFGFFHVLITKRLGWFIFSLPFIFIWTFISQILLGILLGIPTEIIANILYTIVRKF